MSVWTHVTGTIRVDGIAFHLGLENDNEISINPPLDLGVQTIREEYPHNATKKEMDAYYKRAEENWKASQDSGIPMGSEGSLHWEWVPNMGMYVISGDLRDYETAEPIYEWLKELKTKFDNSQLFLRQIAVQVDVEGKTPVFIGLEYDEKLQEERLVKYEITANGVLLYAKD